MAKTEDKVVSEFVNPYANGVSYEAFLKAKGKLSVEDYCKDKLTDEQIKFLINDLKHYNPK